MSEQSKEPTAAEKQACARAANRLHHLSMIYGGAIVEVAQGRDVGLLPIDHPGLKTVRDLADLILLTRAEISALTRLMVDRGVFTSAEYTRQATDDYQYIAKCKSEQFGVELSDVGIVIKGKKYPDA